jgi:hypothetical protein
MKKYHEPTRAAAVIQERQLTCRLYAGKYFGSFVAARTNEAAHVLHYAQNADVHLLTEGNLNANSVTTIRGQRWLTSFRTAAMEELCGVVTKTAPSGRASFSICTTACRSHTSASVSAMPRCLPSAHRLFQVECPRRANPTVPRRCPSKAA